MQLTPRYDGEPVLRVEGAIPDPAEMLIQQRRRLTGLLADLADEQWTAPSRCDAWAVRDVVAHLVDVDRFWTFSVGAGRAGEPSTFLATFDPVTSPPALVAAHASAPPAELLRALVEGVDGLAASLEGADHDVLAEAPPGHIPIGALALRALWDGWVHERDIALPLGLDPVEEDDEVTASLLYAAALGPAFAACAGSPRSGALVVEATDPDARVVVAIGSSVVAALGGSTPPDAVVLSGPAVDLVEALSLRAPFPTPLAADDRWALGTLDVVFDQS